MLNKIMEGMNKQDMKTMMDECCAHMTEENKQKMAEEIKGGCCKEGELPIMPQMMIEMMPKCLNMMLPKVSRENRIDFVLKMVSTLTEQGSQGFSDEEKKYFVVKIIEKVINS